MYQPPLVFNPWILFACLMFLLLAVVLLVWRMVGWTLVERALQSSHWRAGVALASRGGPVVILTASAGLGVIGVGGLVLRWGQLEPNGFVQALDRASSHPALVAVGLGLYSAGLILTSISERVTAGLIRSRPSGRTRLWRLLPVSVGFSAALVGALLVTNALDHAPS